ncbi:MAG: hypothetical protein ABIJ21_03340 [Nanoarchaeota archaeon]
MITAKTIKKELLQKEIDPLRGQGCKMGSGFVLDEEVPLLARHAGKTLEAFEKEFLQPGEVFHTKTKLLKTRKTGKPYGPCVFLQKDDACGFGKNKPLYCAITNNDEREAAVQWFQLSHYVNLNDPTSIREWHAYAQGIKVIPGGKPEELVGKERLKEILEYKELK